MLLLQSPALGVLRFSATFSRGAAPSLLPRPLPRAAACAHPTRSSLESAIRRVAGEVTGAVRFMASALGASPGPAWDAAQKWWTPDTVAVVTGSNKGIGLAIARGLAQAGLTTVLTSRDPKLGEEALERLRAEGVPNLVYHQLDITDSASVKAFAKWVEETYRGVDVLVNNAGMAYKGSVFGAQEAEVTIRTNYGGTRDITEALLPLLRPSAHGARVVNVCSQAGLLKILSPELQKRITDPSLTLELLDQLASEFVSGIKAGTYREQGWPQSMYGVSKVLESAYTRVLAQQLHSRPDGKKVFVNACCPGYVATDMSSHKGYLTTEQGADTPIFLALLPASSSTSGAFFFQRAERSF